MRVDDFDYTLPPELIAQQPSDKRDASRMMVLNRTDKSIHHAYFYNILDFLQPSDLLILNNAKVIPARIFAKKETGANIEIFLVNKLTHTSWECMIRPSKRIKSGTKIFLQDGSFVVPIDRAEDGNWIIETPTHFDDILSTVGEMPLPPYIKREKENDYREQDLNRYQTVYAKEAGALAAPTAGLHFTEDIIEKAKQKGVTFAEVTLNVGLGTFKPVKADHIKDHVMHKEYFQLSPETAMMINEAKKDGRRVVAVGTTAIRTIEAVASMFDGQVKPYAGWTDIFIYPGYEFQVIDACITNFHLPKSTLIMLMAAFAGKEFIFKAYEEAIQNNYRFYSYGDCMFVQ